MNEGINIRYSKSLIFLLVLQVFLANTGFNTLQIIVELMLMLILSGILYKHRLNKNELALILLLITSNFLSFIFNEFIAALLILKITYLSTISLVLFKKVILKLDSIKYYIYINIALIILQHIDHVHPFPNFVSFMGGGWSEFIDGRPLGIFLNTHTSGFFLAIYILSEINKINIKFLIYFYILWATTSLTNNIACLLQILLNKTRIKYLIILIILIILPIFLVIIFKKNLIFQYFIFLEDNEWHLISKDRLMGIGVVLDQLTNYNSYFKAINLLPTDFSELYQNPDDIFGNEITYFFLLQHFGIIFFIFYLYNFLKYADFFKIFICVSLIHYGDITSPLFIMLLIQYSLKYKNNE